MPICCPILPIVVMSSALAACGGGPAPQSGSSSTTAPSGERWCSDRAICANRSHCPDRRTSEHGCAKRRNCALVARSGWQLICSTVPQPLPRLHRLRRPLCRSHLQATGHPVKVQNLSQHTGLQINGLLHELKTDVKSRDALANADIIVVSIAQMIPPGAATMTRATGRMATIPTGRSKRNLCDRGGGNVPPEVRARLRTDRGPATGKPTILPDDQRV